MKKEELKKKLLEFAQKSKKISKDLFITAKTKAEDIIEDIKDRRKAAKLAKQVKAKTKKQKTAKIKNLYDKKEKTLQPRYSSFDVKPMSFRGQKVPTHSSFFSSFSKNFTLTSDLSFSGFTIKVIYLGSAFISAWLLGLSFYKEPTPYFAFLALFLIGFTIRHIKDYRGSLCYGFLTGFFTNVCVLGWIFDTVFFGTLSYPLSIVSLAGLSLILALPMMLFSFLAWQYKHKLWLYPLASACAWVALELVVQLLSYKSFGFPWFVLGYTQYADLKLIQISSILGAYGISFFIVFCSFSASLVLGTRVQLKDRFIALLSILAMCFVFYSYGEYQLSTVQEEDTKTLRVALVQPNTHRIMLENDMGQMQKALDSVAQILKSKENLDLVVWPESTIPGFLEESPLQDFMAKLSQDTKAAHVAGGSAHKKIDSKKKNKDNNTEADTQDFVAAGLYKNGKLTSHHYKRKLVPFGEFLPYQEQLKDFYEGNGISSLTGSFTEGRGPAQVLDLQTGDTKTSFGAQICFESIFPILWRLEALGGAEFFVNISNDGWFLNTAAPYQHLGINVFRAVENNRPVLRSANTGISAFIDPFGKIKYRTLLNEKSVEIVEVSLPQVPSQTFYTIYGDIFAFLCLFLTLVFSYNCLDVFQKYD